MIVPVVARGARASGHSSAQAWAGRCARLFAVACFSAFPFGGSRCRCWPALAAPSCIRPLGGCAALGAMPGGGTRLQGRRGADGGLRQRPAGRVGGRKLRCNCVECLGCTLRLGQTKLDDIAQSHTRPDVYHMLTLPTQDPHPPTQAKSLAKTRALYTRAPNK